MRVYKIDENGYYLGEHECQVCPKTGGWLYPANYTTKEPVIEEYKNPRFVDGKWKQEEDNHGRIIYNKETGRKEICPEIFIPETHTTIAPPVPTYPYYVFRGGEWIIDDDKKKDYDKSIIVNSLSATDYKMSRINEDLIDILILKDVIKLTDLPTEVQAAIKSRKDLRKDLSKI